MASMHVRIDEMHSRVDTIDSDALLTPAALDRIVRAVLRAMEDRHRSERVLRADIDLRSIVEQQRQGGRS